MSHAKPDVGRGGPEPPSDRTGASAGEGRTPGPPAPTTGDQDRSPDPAPEPIQPAQPAKTSFHVPLAYLRAFIIVLVVAQHAAMPYNVIAPIGDAGSLQEHYETMRAIAPVIDAQRSDMLSLFGAFNDTFMMALLFLVSGVFTWGSLTRRGGATYARDRLIRLGIPLLVMAALRPLSHLPTYLAIGGEGGLGGFWSAWSDIAWRGGPIWFLELLLMFNLGLALVVALWGRLGGRGLPGPTAWSGRPGRLFGLIVVLSALAYVPITAAIGDFLWLQIGPAQVQANRVLFYAVYFFVGVWLGVDGVERTCLMPGSVLARRWPIWTAFAVVAFTLSLVASIAAANPMVTGPLLVVASAAISFAFLAVFLAFVRTRRRVADSLFENSYGIYVVHYGIVAWAAFAVLDAQLPAAAKWVVVFVASLLVSWGVIAAVRRIPLVDRVI